MDQGRSSAVSAVNSTATSGDGNGVNGVVSDGVDGVSDGVDGVNDDADDDDGYKLFEKTELEMEEDRLALRVEENRDQRINASRRLEQMRKQGNDRQKRYDEVEKDLLLLHKRELYEHIIHERLAEEEIRRKMENLELEQRLILLKLEEIEEQNVLKKDCMDSVSMREMVESTFEPALKRMADIPNVQEIIKRNSESSNFYAEVSAKVSNELQVALRTSHALSKEQLTLKRKELINERFEKEARLQQIRTILHEENSVNGTTTNTTTTTTPPPSTTTTIITTTTTTFDFNHGLINA